MYTYPNELAHHGIQGMKWGVRRYQNEDGTLTEEGRNRYGRTIAKKLNANDRRIAVIKANENSYRIKRNKYKKKSKKALAKNKTDKAERLNKKSKEAAANMRKKTKEIQKLEKDNKKLVDALIADNYDVKVSSVPRVSITKGEVATYAIIAAADTLFPFTAGLGYAYLATRTPITRGHNYKVKTKK